jgi:hypothetical protein
MALYMDWQVASGNGSRQQYIVTWLIFPWMDNCCACGLMVFEGNATLAGA